MKKIIILLIILLSVSAFGQAQKKPLIADFVLGKVQVLKANTSTYKEISKNTLLQEGDLIRTGKNSILRFVDEKGNRYLITANSTFKINTFNNEKAEMQLYTGMTEFNIIKNNNLSVRTPTLVAGVRGTIFKAISDNAGNDQIIVYQGKVEVGSLAQTGEKPLLVDDKKKISWNASEKAFTPTLITAATADDLKFQLLEGTPESNVKQMDEKKMQEAVPLMEEKKLTEAPKKLEANKEPKESKPEKKPEEKKEDSIFKYGFSAGAVERNGELYQSLVFAPEVKLGDSVKVAFYFPVYYDGKNKIYNPSHWGNYDEWDFSDSKDAAHDGLLKIRYLKIKERGDLFYLAIGNLDSITLGSGFVVDQFNLAPLFPVQKVVGMESGFDAGMAGLSVFANDLYDPEIMGGRLFFRPFYGIPLLGKFQFGLTIAVDKNPLGQTNNPAVFHYNFDFFFPLADNKEFSMIFFVDYGRQGTYYRDNSLMPATIQEGWDFNHFHINRYSYGADGGVKGNITQYFNYEFRVYYFHDGYEGSYFDSFYLLNRQKKVNGVIYGAPDDSYGYKLTLGTNVDIFEASAGFFKKINASDEENKLYLHFKTKRGLIYKFWLGIDYEKKYIDRFFTGDESYRQNALLDIKLGYMISENGDLILRKLINYDENGNQQSQIMLETSFMF